LKKPSVGIFAKYVPSEQALCAMCFAHYISMYCYRYVYFFSPEIPDKKSRFYGFSREWDSHIVVTNPMREALKRQLAKNSVFFFFEPETELIKHLHPDCKKIFFLNPYTWLPDYQKFLEQCDSILTMGQTWAAFFQKKIHKKVDFFPFDPMIDCVPRVREKRDKLKLTFPVYGFDPETTEFVHKVVQVLKQVNPNLLTAVINYDKNLTSRDGFDAAADDWRFRKYVYDSDWMIDLNPQAAYGLIPSYASCFHTKTMSYGTSVMHDSYSSLSETNKDFYLSDAPSSLDPAAIVVQDLEKVSRRILDNLQFTDKEYFSRVDDVDRYRNRRILFVRFLNEILGIRTRKSAASLLLLRTR